MLVQPVGKSYKIKLQNFFADLTQYYYVLVYLFEIETSLRKINRRGLYYCLLRT